MTRHWFDTFRRLGLGWETSFDLDFHSIPFHGDDALVEEHSVSKWSRRQKGISAFPTQDDDTHVFCYANAELRKGEPMPDAARPAHDDPDPCRRLGTTARPRGGRHI